MLVVELDVDRRLIDAGRRGSCGSCPIALAALVAMPAFARAIALGMHLKVYDAAGHGHVARLPPEARDFMKAFDEYGPRGVGPLKFPVTFHTLPGAA